MHACSKIKPIYPIQCTYSQKPKKIETKKDVGKNLKLQNL